MRGLSAKPGLCVIATCISVGAVLFPAQVHADAYASGIGLRAGAGSHYQRYELAWVSPSFWHYRFAGSGSRLDLVAEAAAAFLIQVSPTKPYQPSFSLVRTSARG